jgi:hypothetical protein
VIDLGGGFNSGLVDVLLVLSALRSASALRNQRRFWRDTRAGQAAEPTGFARKASIVAPVKGVDPDFEATLRGLLAQRYGAPYELLFAVESESDPAVAAVRAAHTAAVAAGACRAERVEVIVAGRCVDRGQKVHNQTEALKRAASDSEIFAFVDSDGRPDEGWLANLVEPLARDDVGVATGFRWYVPIRGGFASAMASLWNAMTVTLVGGDRRALAWGGAMAIRRDTFVRVGVEARWRGSVSDDGSLSTAVKDAGLLIAFVPKCLVPSLHDFTLASLWEFVVRQYLVVRVYLPRLHRLGLIATLLNVVGFAGGLALSVAGLAAGAPPWFVIGLTVLVYALSVALGAVRYASAREALPAHAAALAEVRGAYLFATPLAWALNLAALLASALRRTIVWRGIRYELRSPTDVVIGHGDPR